MRSNLNKMQFGTALGMAVALSLALGSGARGAERVERRVALMGTLLALEVEAGNRAEALHGSEAAVRAIEAVEARLSTWSPESELSRLNRQPAGLPLLVSPQLASDLRLASRWRESTAGAFDPGIGGLVEAWGLRRGGRSPSEAEIARALEPAGLSSLHIEDDAATRLHPDLVIEEGGFGKGIALDAALAALRKSGAQRAVLDFGGEVALLGPGPFTLAVADPAERSRAVLALEVDGGALATSGNSERGIVVGGERRSHLLDPRTGRPVPDFGSLTVWADGAADADCLSTGLYVLGPDAAMAWAHAHPGIEVLVLLRTADGLRARATPGLATRLAPLVADVQFESEQASLPAPSPALGRAAGANNTEPAPARREHND